MASRSWMRKRGDAPASCSVQARLRACWVTQAAVGWAVQPARWTRRVPTSRKNRACRVLRKSVSTVKKSQASSCSLWRLDEVAPGRRPSPLRGGRHAVPPEGRAHGRGADGGHPRAPGNRRLPQPSHRHALDHRRGSWQRDVASAIEDEARRSDAVLVLEPSLPGGAVKTARKGCGEYELRVRGVAAHAGIDPSKGASAIHELARQIVLVRSFRTSIGRLGQRRHDLGRHAHERCRGGGACGDRRARADAGRRGACGRGVPRAEGRRRPDRRIGHRRLGSSPLERTAQVARLYEQAPTLRASSARRLAREARVAVPTGISPLPWVLRL